MRESSKLIVFKLKNRALTDPVDRLRGCDIVNELRCRGWNVEYFNEQRDIDVLFVLDYDPKTYIDIINFKPKKVVLDIQDDHFTKNGKSLATIPGQRTRKINRIINIFKESSLSEFVFLLSYKFLQRRSLINLSMKADYVVTSSQTLQSVVGKYNSNVITIPDSIDMDIYDVKCEGKNKRKQLVWIGTPSNIRYLLLINDALEKLQSKFDIGIKIITSRQINSDLEFVGIKNEFKFDYNFVEWDAESFSKELISSDIGIAPLPIGISKSTNKILSYMASNLPVVCSGSLDYKELYEENKDAFIFCGDNSCSTWFDSISKLLQDDTYMQQLAHNSKLLSNRYSLEMIGNDYEVLIRELL